jgi:CBS domain containing-hemolysin-like protein
MPDYLQQILLLLLTLFLVLLTGFFVAAEFALVKIRATRVDELAAKNLFGARKLQGALRNLNAYLSATQLGITVATLTLGSFGETVVEALIGPVLKPVPHWMTTAVALTFVTVLEVVIGEIAPKTLAIQRAERIALAVIYPLDLFYKLFQGPIWVMNGLATLVLRPFGLRPSGEHGEGDAHSEDELRLILEASHAGGTIKESELTLVNQVFDFTHRTVREVMVPRPDVTFLDISRPLVDTVAAVEVAGFSRFPLIDGSPDNVIGVVHVKDLLRLTLSGDPAASLAGIARPALSVPETKPVEVLLREFQQKRQRLAVVVDEYGGTAGIVTLEDIVEEIVGDLQDEFDRSAPEMEPAGKDCYTVDGRMAIDKLVRQLDLTVSDALPDIDTVGGLFLATRTGPLRIDDTTTLGGATLTITELAGRRIRRVLVCIPEPADPTLSQSPGEP